VVGPEVETAVKSVAALGFLAKLTLAAFGLFDWPLARVPAPITWNGSAERFSMALGLALFHRPFKPGADVVMGLGDFDRGRADRAPWPR
jgi:hypothetical protein